MSAGPAGGRDVLPAHPQAAGHRGTAVDGRRGREEAEVLGPRVGEVVEADDPVAPCVCGRPAGEVARADEEVVAQVGARPGGEGDVRA